MRRTKIVATIGPASEEPDVLSEVVAAGMDVARLNFSHGRRADLERRLQRLVAQRDADPEHPLGILVDTRGPEIRIGAFPGGCVHLATGRLFRLYPDGRDGDEDGVGVGYEHLLADVHPGQIILLDDGNLTLRVQQVDAQVVTCVVEAGGELLSGKKVNLPGVDLSLPPLQPDDEADLALAAAYQADFVAVSFVRTAEDILEARRVIEATGWRMGIIAKIETRQGVTNAEEILRVSDGLMVARGDLGVELPAEEVPIVQKDLIRRCVEVGKPVITATQMLESMVHHSRPTRAEASDVANAIFDGSDAVMLSAETAIGKYPVETVRTMARIAVRAEQALPYREQLARRATTSTSTVTDAIGYATAVSAQNLGASAIVSVTGSGHTACTLAKYRPGTPILGMTADDTVVRRLTLVWGVRPLKLSGGAAVVEDTIAQAVQRAVEVGAVSAGDLVVITAGMPTGLPGTTNMLRVQTVGDVVLRGRGVGTGSGSGRVIRVRDAQDAARHFHAGDVLVAVRGTRELVPFMERAAAIITEEDGLASPAASVGLSLGIPVMVGAEGAMHVLVDHEEVTIDSTRGLCYRGRARIS